MRTFPTSLTIGAKPRKIEPTDFSSDVSFRAIGAEGAEAAGVVWTGRWSGRGVSVEVEAVGGIGAGKCAEVVRAVWHTAPIIYYQFHQVQWSEIALVPLLSI